MSRFLYFFFSSRRRHTRCLSDWSSDVCSSDLFVYFIDDRHDRHVVITWCDAHQDNRCVGRPLRSEERRVGKECRFGLSRSTTIQIDNSCTILTTVYTLSASKVCCIIM